MAPALRQSKITYHLHWASKAGVAWPAGESFARVAPSKRTSFCPRRFCMNESWSWSAWKKKYIYIYTMCIALYANTTCSSGSQPVHRFAKPLWGNRRVLIPVAGFHQRLLQELPRKSGDILMDKPSRPQAAQGSELQHGQSDTGVSTELRRNKKPPN